ncbi:hypothetical protein [Microlunatus speluncae]|uniref:hypothetical protein n=1 Tax=Microlunatus speluncae TaxID=2594267 RepID=UPI0012662F99|nr:hypothetical protein [Microlunatus speluncae]
MNAPYETEPYETEPAAGPACAIRQDLLGDGEKHHAVGALRGWIADLTGRVPTTLCGASLLAEPDDPAPDTVLPICLDCVDALRPIERNEAVERVKAAVSRRLERWGLEPLRPAGDWQDLSDYAAAFAQLYRLGELARDGRDLEVEHGLDHPAVTAFWRTYGLERTAARQAVRKAGRRLSGWQERTIRACYPPIRSRAESTMSNEPTITRRAGQ